MKPLDCFRKATKALTAKEPKDKRIAFKQKMASYAGLTKSQLDDLVMGRRVGKEETRRKIAKFFDYDDYSDFLLLGEKLLEDATIEEAEEAVRERRLMRPDPDGSIEKILQFWPRMTAEQKVELRRQQRLMVFQNTDWFGKLDNYEMHSSERFLYLWDSVVGKGKSESPISRDAVTLLESYTKGEAQDVDVLECADEFGQKIP